MTSKTMEDWFLRGGERPNTFSNHDAHDDGVPPDSPHESDECGTCDECGMCDECDECDDDDDEEALQDWVVTMSRTKTVQQTAKVRVKAHSEEEALDLVEDRAEDEADHWPWKDEDDTVEFEDTEAIEAEVAR